MGSLSFVETFWHALWLWVRRMSPTTTDHFPTNSNKYIFLKCLKGVVLLLLTWCGMTLHNFMLSCSKIACPLGVAYSSVYPNHISEQSVWPIHWWAWEEGRSKGLPRNLCTLVHWDLCYLLHDQIAMGKPDLLAMGKFKTFTGKSFGHSGKVQTQGKEQVMELKWGS